MSYQRMLSGNVACLITVLILEKHASEYIYIIHKESDTTSRTYTSYSQQSKEPVSAVTTERYLTEHKITS